MKNFTYHAPQTITAALMLLDQALARSEDTYILAGGTVLVPQIKESLVRPSLVISLKHLPMLKKITLDEKGLHLGALITPVELIRSPVILEHYPVLAQAAATMAGVQIRNMATIEGNLCSAVPTADLVPSLLAPDAIVQVQGPNGLRPARRVADRTRACHKRKLSPLSFGPSRGYAGH